MPRFVILQHETPLDADRPTHWDLMLETGLSLRTWALDEEPQPGKTIQAEALTDHRLAYLDYEGPISDNRGDVHRWDVGKYQAQSVRQTVLVVTLAGHRLQCQATLTRQEPNSTGWAITFA
jgi:hypothetical protein